MYGNMGGFDPLFFDSHLRKFVYRRLHIVYRETSVKYNSTIL